MRAVVYAIFIQIALSFLDKEHRLTPRQALPIAGNGRPWGPRRRHRLRRRWRDRRDDHQNRTRPSAELDSGQHCPRNHRKPGARTRFHGYLRRARGGGARPGRARHGVVRDQLGDRRARSAGPRRRRSRGGHVRLLLRRAFGGDATDGAGLRRRFGDHRRPGDGHDDADVEVHAARLPRPVRLRAHRQRRRSARPAVDRRYGLDGSSFRAGSRCAGGRHRRLADCAVRVGRSGCCAHRRPHCCSICTRRPSPSGPPCSRSRSH